MGVRREYMSDELAWYTSLHPETDTELKLAEQVLDLLDEVDYLEVQLKEVVSE